MLKKYGFLRLVGCTALLGASLLAGGCNGDAASAASVDSVAVANDAAYRTRCFWHPTRCSKTPVTNTAPAIAGTPATTATVGVAYSFRPTASDANGDALSFSITNQPGWASFNTTTGALTGTPAAGNVGAKTGIVISVSDGKATTLLPAFSITVAAAADSGGSSGGGITACSGMSTGTAADLNGFRLFAADSAWNQDISQLPADAQSDAYMAALGTATPLHPDFGTQYGIPYIVVDGQTQAKVPVNPGIYGAESDPGPFIPHSRQCAGRVGQQRYPCSRARPGRLLALRDLRRECQRRRQLEWRFDGAVGHAERPGAALWLDFRRRRRPADLRRAGAPRRGRARQHRACAALHRLEHAPRLCRAGHALGEQLDQHDAPADGRAPAPEGQLQHLRLLRRQPG